MTDLRSNPKTFGHGKRIRGKQIIFAASFVRFVSSLSASAPAGAASEQAENDDAGRLPEG
jgi:hypothetical protein